MALYGWKYLGKAGIYAGFPDGVAQVSNGTLSNAQCLALHTTPVALVAAPGTGKYIDIESITLLLEYGSVAFTGNNALEFRYTNGSGNKVTGDAAFAWAQGTANAAVKVIQVAVTPIVNAAVVAAVPSADWAAGDSTIGYSVKYRIVTLP